MVTPVLSGPVNTSDVHKTSPFNKQTVAPSSEGTEKDCVSVTWQLPKDASSLQGRWQHLPVFISTSRLPIKGKSFVKLHNRQENQTWDSNLHSKREASNI